MMMDAKDPSPFPTVHQGIDESLPEPPVAVGDTRATLDWQRRLLPIMATVVVSLALFFFVASLFQLYLVQQRIEASPTLELAPAFEGLKPEPNNPTLNRDILEFARWRTLTLLEAHTMARRYHQANVLLMARVWVRYLGFVTGMILAVMGAVFVLGKLREPTTSLSGETGGIKGNISTTSPGLVLVVLGTVLMLTTILTHNQIDVRDGPVYTAITYTDAAPPEDVASMAGSRSSTPSSAGNKRQSSQGQASSGNDEVGLQAIGEEALKRLGVPSGVPSSKSR